VIIIKLGKIILSLSKIKLKKLENNKKLCFNLILPTEHFYILLLIKANYS